MAILVRTLSFGQLYSRLTEFDDLHRYDTCDVGTLANQTLNGQPATAATAGGNPKYNNNLSWQSGQRLSYVVVCPLSMLLLFSAIVSLISIL